MEKPIASSLAEADRLLEAQGSQLLAVGHVEYFNPAVQALLALDLDPGFLEIQRFADGLTDEGQRNLGQPLSD